MEEKLDLRSLIGRRQVVVPRYVKQIEKKLNNATNEQERQILTAYLTAFKYYEEISNMDGPFVKQSMVYFNREAKYLKEKFPFATIEPQGRIKSPLSADTKIRKKIKEYIEKGRDLNNITDSLRDFIGFRYIISLPRILDADPKKATEVCYQILEAQMDFQKENGFEFIPVGDKKQAGIKGNKTYLANPKEKGVFIPDQRPVGIDEKYDPYLKDYIMHPTKSLYQSAQYCMIPPWAKDMKNGHPAAIETQVRTDKMHEFAETDNIASHKNYKKRAQEFHRLSIPFEFTYMPDEYGNITDRIGQIPYDYSIQKFHGTSFYDHFGIDYADFLQFDQETQDQIYAGNYHVKLIDNDYQVIRTPPKQKTISLVRKAFDKFKFTMAHPVQSFKKAISYTIDDDRGLF